MSDFMKRITNIFDDEAEDLYKENLRLYDENGTLRTENLNKDAIIAMYKKTLKTLLREKDNLEKDLDYALSISEEEQELDRAISRTFGEIAAERKISDLVDAAIAAAKCYRRCVETGLDKYEAWDVLEDILLKLKNNGVKHFSTFYNI